MGMLAYLTLAGLMMFLLGLLGRRARRPVRLLVIALGAVFGLWGLLAGAFSPVLAHSADPWWRVSPWLEILLFLAMVSGMASKFLWDAIERRRAKLKSSPSARLDLDVWDLVQPLLVSAIVFSAVLGTERPAGIAGLLFSFQNGFCWQTVFARKTK